MELWLPVAFIVLLLVLTFDQWPRVLLCVSRAIWRPYDEAARYFRDRLETLELRDAAATFDGMTGQQSTGEAFHTWMLIGFDEGILEVWGRPALGTKKRRLNPPSRNNIDDLQKYEANPNSMVLRDRGLYFDLEIRRSTINSLVDRIRRDETVDRHNRNHRPPR